MIHYIRKEGSKGRSIYFNEADPDDKVLDNLKDLPEFLALKATFDSGENTFEEYEGSVKQAQDLADKSAGQYKEDRAIEYAKKTDAEQREMIMDAILYPDTPKGRVLGEWYNGIKDSIDL